MAKKKFKLVYEKDGFLKGSNTGIPADADADLIEIAVLEGSKPVPPAPAPGPAPHGNIEITTTEKVDVANYATAQVVDANLKPENIKKDVVILDVTGTFEDALEELMQETF